jgi:hypothetical protein
VAVAAVIGRGADVGVAEVDEVERVGRFHEVNLPYWRRVFLRMVLSFVTRVKCFGVRCFGVKWVAENVRFCPVNRTFLSS